MATDGARITLDRITQGEGLEEQVQAQNGQDSNKLVPREPRSSFSRTLESIMSANVYSRATILQAACDARAFSCEEIIHLANNSWPFLAPYPWLSVVMTFTEGRNDEGCVSDPANGRIITNVFRSLWPAATTLLGILRQALPDNRNLKPAKDVRRPPLLLKTCHRSDADMNQLLQDLERLHLIKFYGTAWGEGWYEPWSLNVEELTTWFKKIRAHGEQLSGPQLVSLVDAIPESPRMPQAVSVLLQHFEQYVTGVTCEEVKLIIRRLFGTWTGRERFMLLGLDALKSNIVDVHNKAEIVAFTDLLVDHDIVQLTETSLRDVGVSRPPKNNPVFGVVRGNPVIFMVDDSIFMDAAISLGHETFTRRKVCQSHLETSLAGLPNGTYFNVIQYGSHTRNSFPKPVLVSKANIDAVMQVVSGTWRSEYTPGQDPMNMILNIKAFALNLKYRLDRGAKTNSLEALQAAYSLATWSPQQTKKRKHTPPEEEVHVSTTDSPQIYFLASGQLDAQARQILSNIDEFDKHRKIPVNSIAFMMPADSEAKQLVKDLANKTGGFFRVIEHAS